MNALLAIALVTLSLQFATTAAALTLGSTPRWRRARWFAAVSFTAGCYALVDVLAASFISEGTHIWATRTNLVLGTAHASAWLVYTHIGEDGRWSTLPTWVRRCAIGALGTMAFLSITGVFIVEPQPASLDLRALGLSYESGRLTTFGTLVTGVPVAFFLLTVAEYWRRWRKGEPGAGSILIGFSFFLAAVVEEIAVAAGVVQWVYLADVGYVFAITPVAVQMLVRFRDEALQLDKLTRELSAEVDRRTEERDAAQRGMVEQQRLAALGRLAAGVGHEINNPLQYLRFSLEELQEHLPSPRSDDAKVAMDQAFEGVDRIRQVVEGLRTYVRPTDMELTRVDMREVVRAAVRVGAPQWRQGVEVDTRLGDVPAVEGHEGRLVQVILNPLVNAAQALLHASRDFKIVTGTQIVVTTRTNATGDVEVDIVDNGPGFPASIIARLGEPYVTTRAGDGGTGLGLFVTRGIVEAHGGTIVFANRVNGGASVRITLPAAAAGEYAEGKGRTPTPQATPVIREKRPRVLLVEDDPAAQRALLRGLDAEGFDAHGFEEAIDALDRLNRESFDIVITDLMMPGMSGWEFARRLEVAHPALHARLIVLTGGASTPEADAFLQEPGLVVLDKPIDRRELGKQIRQRLASAQPSAQASA